jgi:hypothetical protein
LTAFIGDYPNDVDDSDVIDFQKAAGDGEDRHGSSPEAEAFPNPFNPSTVIRFRLPDDGYVNLSVFDVRGRLVKELLDGYSRAGDYNIPFDAGNLPSGVYYYRIKTEHQVESGKMLLVK